MDNISVLSQNHYSIILKAEKKKRRISDENITRLSFAIIFILFTETALQTGGKVYVKEPLTLGTLHSTSSTEVRWNEGEADEFAYIQFQARKAMETGFVDVLMFSVNAAYDMQPASEDCNDLWAPESYKNRLEGIRGRRYLGIRYLI